MSWEEYQGRILRRNPELMEVDGKMRISHREFFRQIKMAFEAGAENSKTTERPLMRVPDFFRNLFGG